MCAFSLQLIKMMPYTGFEIVNEIFEYLPINQKIAMRDLYQKKNYTATQLHCKFMHYHEYIWKVMQLFLFCTCETTLNQKCLDALTKAGQG